MSVVTPVQPTVAQQAAIRQAGAEQNVSAGITTEISQNPTEATSAYDALTQAQAEPAGTPGSYQTSTPGQLYSVAPPFQRNVFSQQSNLIPATSAASLSRFNQANQGGYTFQTVARSPFAQGPIIRGRGPPQTNRITSYTEYSRGTSTAPETSIQQTNLVPQLGIFGTFLTGVYRAPEIFQVAGNKLFATGETYRSSPNILTRLEGSPFFVGGIASQAVGGITSFYNPSALRFNTSTSQGRLTIFSEGVGIAASFAIGGGALKGFEAATGIARLSRPAAFAARLGYGSALGVGQSLFTGQNPIEGGLITGVAFAGAPELIGFARPLISRAGSFLGSEVRSAADTAYERIFLRSGLTKPSIASDADFLTKMGEIYQQQNYAQAAKDIYSQVGKGVNAYTYNPPEYRSYNTPIRNPYETFGEQVTTEDINKALGLPKGGGSISSKNDLFSENVSRNGTITLQRTKQVTEELQLTEEKFIQQSRQDYFASLIPRTRSRTRQQEQLQIYQYPETGLKTQQDLFPRFAQAEKQDFAFSLDFATLQTQGFKQQFQFQESAFSTLQAQKTQLAQKDLQVSRQDFRQLFEVQQSSQSKSLFLPTSRKQKRKKKGKRGRKSYREFGNILNLRQFEF